VISLETAWIDRFQAFEIGAEDVEQLTVDEHGAHFAAWTGEDLLTIDRAELFGNGEERAAVVTWSSRPSSGVILGQAGETLVRYDAVEVGLDRVARLDRVDGTDRGMHRFDAVEVGDGVLVEWELGVLRLSRTFDLVWQRDLEWNHEQVSLGEGEVWFDLLYDERDSGRRIGDAPYGFALDDGRPLPAPG
jgi:hypothetical protein